MYDKHKSGESPMTDAELEKAAVEIFTLKY